MLTDVLIVLGSPNNSEGVLSDTAISRLNCCVKHYEKDMLVLCTGGWGAHFNITEQAHAFCAKQYLITQGIPESAFLDFALSQHTVDDAVKTLAIISKLKNIRLTVITSDYHLKRVKLIFETILASYSMKFIGAKSNLDKKAYDFLIAHEEKAIRSITKNGLYY
ncbi:YdcF family protein [Snuella sedimenti]|uniref:YdcF family protein n=1 Tax=Snuella sedimenti TaxID=2798802 RepID=A0A8J7IVV9_9FLAO|nr:YdcF family protein [Snuella sedimenti]MBJ6367945.1 YdcF family protein [Snuella sedimenti]